MRKIIPLRYFTFVVHKRKLLKRWLIHFHTLLPSHWQKYQLFDQTKLKLKKITMQKDESKKYYPEMYWKQKKLNHQRDVINTKYWTKFYDGSLSLLYLQLCCSFQLMLSSAVEYFQLNISPLTHSHSVSCHNKRMERLVCVRV